MFRSSLRYPPLPPLPLVLSLLPPPRPLPLSLLPLLLLMIASACGGHSPTAPSINLAGNWQGNFMSDADEPGTFTLQLNQSGTNVTGSASMAQNEFTNIPGTWTGTLPAGATSMPFTLNYSFGPQPCLGVFNGTVNVTSQSFEGSFSGHNCGRTFNGTIRATRVN